MYFQLPRIETNLPRDNVWTPIVTTALAHSFAYQDNAQKSGISNPFWRVRPTIYFEVEPKQADLIFGVIPANPHHPFAKRYDMYQSVIDKIDGRTCKMKPRLIIIQPGDDKAQWAKDNFSQNIDSLTLAEAHRLSAVATVQGLSGAQTIVQPLVHVMARANDIRLVLDRAKNNQDVLLAQFRDLYAAPIIYSYNTQPRRHRSELSQYAPVKKQKGGRKPKPKCG